MEQVLLAQDRWAKAWGPVAAVCAAAWAVVVAGEAVAGALVAASDEVRDRACLGKRRLPLQRRTTLANTNPVEALGRYENRRGQRQGWHR